MSSSESSKNQLESNKSKKYCRLCCQHDVDSYRSQHTCPFENCTCKKCRIIQLQRKIMSQQIQLRRMDDKANKSKGSLGTSTLDDKSTSKYFCQLCKNHGIQILKKSHIDCPYAECVCERCSLTKARSYVELEIKRSCLSSPYQLNKKSGKRPKNRLSEEMFDKMHDIFMTPNDSNQKIASKNLVPSDTQVYTQEAQNNNSKCNKINAESNSQILSPNPDSSNCELEKHLSFNSPLNIQIDGQQRISNNEQKMSIPEQQSLDSLNWFNVNNQFNPFVGYSNTLSFNMLTQQPTMQISQISRPEVNALIPVVFAYMPSFQNPQ